MHYALLKRTFLKIKNECNLICVNFKSFPFINAPLEFPTKRVKNALKLELFNSILIKIESVLRKISLFHFEFFQHTLGFVRLAFMTDQGYTRSEPALLSQ